MTISDLNVLTRFLTGTDTASYTAAQLLINTNVAYEEIVSKIIGMDGRWDFDDSNFTTFPIGTQTLIDSQNDYAFDVTQLEVQRVEVKDNSGLWHELVPIDKSQIDGAIDEFEKTDGLPWCYDKQGSSILLYPAPDNGVSVTLASGLKVYFKRTASVFTSAEVTTGTKVPGFASPFHSLISYKAAIPFAVVNLPQRVPALMAEVTRMEKGLEQHYGRREQDRRKTLQMRPINSR